MTTVDEDGECIHGLGPITACTICNGREAKQLKDRWLVWRVFPAQYEGKCRRCQGDIIVGETIGDTATDEPEYIHQGCITGESMVVPEYGRYW